MKQSIIRSSLYTGHALKSVQCLFSYVGFNQVCVHITGLRGLAHSIHLFTQYILNLLKKKLELEKSCFLIKIFELLPVNLEQCHAYIYHYSKSRVQLNKKKNSYFTTQKLQGLLPYMFIKETCKFKCLISYLYFHRSHLNFHIRIFFSLLIFCEKCFLIGELECIIACSLEHRLKPGFFDSSPGMITAGMLSGPLFPHLYNGDNNCCSLLR